MKCEKCGSENISVQVVNENHYKKGHGLFGILFFGIYYVAWWMCKWLVKISVACCYYLFHSWIALIICKATKKEYRKPEWFKKLMRVNGKNYNEQKKMAVCQNCGHSMIIK